MTIKQLADYLYKYENYSYRAALIEAKRRMPDAEYGGGGFKE